jgi:hypothetical protein
VDYGFAPGTTAQDGRARILFQRRANTTLVSGKKLVTVRGFMNHLRTSAAVARPIGDALIGAHANSEGFMFIALFAKQPRTTDYEIVEDTIATASKSIAIDDTVIGHSPGDPITHNVHFKGCNLGKALPFLTKFHEALGGNVTVTAPIHFHGIWQHSDFGTWEYMAYEFQIRNKTAYGTRAALLAAFDAGGFTFIDGSAVPTADWGKWVPKKITKSIKLDVTGKLGLSIGKRKTIPAERQFRVVPLTYSRSLTYPNAGSVPSGAAARQAAFESLINADPEFDSNHPYPIYVRMGYATLADFYAGYTWKHERVKNVLTTTGSRVEYTILLPIVDMASGNLVFNFHPKAGKPYAPITQLAETDPLYFASV